MSDSYQCNSMFKLHNPLIPFLKEASKPFPKENEVVKEFDQQ